MRDISLVLRLIFHSRFESIVRRQAPVIGIFIEQQDEMLKSRILLLTSEILCNFEPTNGGLPKSESKKSLHPKMSEG